MKRNHQPIYILLSFLLAMMIVVGANGRDLSRNFTYAEFACPKCGKAKVDPALINALQELRDRVGQPVIVSSGYRCPDYNRAVGGASDSLHLEGKAADIYVRGYTAVQLYRLVSEIPAFTGIGVYPQNNFVHVDLRKTPNQWGYLSGKYVPIQQILERERRSQ